MNHSIEIREMEPMRIAYMRYKGLPAEANKMFPNVFKSIRGKANGAPFFNFISMNLATKEAEIELCVPTSETPNGSGIEVKDIPRIKALCLVHEGPYDTLPDAYSHIQEYALQHNLELTMPFREVYIKGPGMILKGNPSHYITEIIYPIKES